MRNTTQHHTQQPFTDKSLAMRQARATMQTLSGKLGNGDLWNLAGDDEQTRWAKLGWLNEHTLLTTASALEDELMRLAAFYQKALTDFQTDGEERLSAAASNVEQLKTQLSAAKAARRFYQHLLNQIQPE